MAREIVIKWHKNQINGAEKPRIYWFKDGKPVRQLRLLDIQLLVNEKTITDERVIEWLKCKEEVKLEASKDAPKPIQKFDENGEWLAPGSKELYDYLSGLYKIKTWGNV